MELVKHLGMETSPQAELFCHLPSAGAPGNFFPAKIMLRESQNKFMTTPKNSCGTYNVY